MHNQLDQLLQDRAHLRYYAHMLALPRSLAGFQMSRLGWCATVAVIIMMPPSFAPHL